MIMKRILSSTVIFLLSVFMLTACGSKTVQDTVSKELGIDVSSGEEVSNYDTHSGLNGDGISYVVLSFSNDTVVEKIQSNSSWKSFPLDETVETLVYGFSDETSSVEPYLSDDEGNALVPKIQNGYYLLIDRQVESEKASGADILHRPSFNFTLGLYDTDTNTYTYSITDQDIYKRCQGNWKCRRRFLSSGYNQVLGEEFSAKNGTILVTGGGFAIFVGKCLRIFGRHGTMIADTLKMFGM